MHAAVLVDVRGQVELAQDATDVSLHGLSRHVELFRDPAIGLPLGDQDEHLALARGQLRERIAGHGRCHQLVDERRLDDGSARGDASQRGDELVDVADAVLEQVADTLLTIRSRASTRSPRRRTGRGRPSRTCGIGGANLLRSHEALVRVRRRHADVHDRDVRRVGGDESDEIVGGACLADDVDPVAPREAARCPRGRRRRRRRGSRAWDDGRHPRACCRLGVSTSRLAVERLDAVAEASEPRSARHRRRRRRRPRPRPTTRPFVRAIAMRGPRRVRVLRHVRERLARDEVGRGLDPLGQALGAVTSSSTGTGARRASAASAGREALVREDRRMDAARERPELVERADDLGVRLREKLVDGASPSAMRPRASWSARRIPSRRCWAPSWRSRSSRRRSASPASTMRAREARTSASWALSSACRRAFSSARLAAAPTASRSSGSSSERRVVDERGDASPVVLEHGDGASFASGHVERAPAGIDVALVRGQPERELEGRIAERARRSRRGRRRVARATGAPRPGRRHRSAAGACAGARRGRRSGWPRRRARSSPRRVACPRSRRRWRPRCRSGRNRRTANGARQEHGVDRATGRRARPAAPSARAARR